MEASLALGGAPRIAISNRHFSQTQLLPAARLWKLAATRHSALRASCPTGDSAENKQAASPNPPVTIPHGRLHHALGNLLLTSHAAPLFNHRHADDTAYQGPHLCGAGYGQMTETIAAMYG
jgi:hypothetical protein